MSIPTDNKRAAREEHYPPESAGRIMTSAIPTVRPHQTIGDARDMLFERSRDFETVNYIYVVGKDARLEGVLSIRDVFRLPAHARTMDVMARELVTVRARTDQELVARLALRHNLKAIPVVDRDGELLGAVPSDVILNVVNDEHSEDLLYGEGVSKINSAHSIIHARLRPLVLARLPWLVFGLAGGLAAARVLGGFEELLERELALALFIPVIVYMSDAVGSQSQTIFIRSMALDHDFSTRKYAVRELTVGAIIAAIIAAALSAVSYAWKGSAALSLTLGLSIAVTVVISVALALLIPVVLLKLKRDTAVGSGPFATILRDLASVTVYFLIAQAILSSL